MATVSKQFNMIADRRQNWITSNDQLEDKYAKVTVVDICIYIKMAG